MERFPDTTRPAEQPAGRHEAKKRRRTKSAAASKPDKAEKPSKQRPVDEAIGGLLLENRAAEKRKKTTSEARPLELKKDELYLGEGVLKLDEPEVEREIPLHAPILPAEKPEAVMPTKPAESSAAFELNKKPEKPPVAHPEPEEQITVPADRRVETSAWHRIEVDAKTGRPVDNPTLEYGEEYYRERRPETEPRDHDISEAAGEVALVAASLDNQAEASRSAADIPLASTQKPLGPSSGLSRGGRQRRRANGQAAGPLWPYVAVLVVIIIAIILALL